MNIFAFVMKPFNHMSKKSKLITILVLVNLIAYGSAYFYFSSNQNTLSVSHTSDNLMINSNASSSIVDFTIGVLQLLKQN